MCELFGMSAAVDAQAVGALQEFRLRGGLTADNADGWGLAYWQGDGFRIHKEPEPAAESALFQGLCQSLRSNLIVAHVRKARFPPVRGMLNTHPFRRTCCGKDWVFAHNGLVPEIVELEIAGENLVCKPLGETDSEYAFCHLLGHIAHQFGRRELSNARGWFDTLASVSESVASYGKFNFLMSDGEHLIAYGHDRLHFLERDETRSPGNGASDTVLIATEPLDHHAGWIPFQPGELRIYRLGGLAGKVMTRPHSAATDVNTAAVSNSMER